MKSETSFQVSFLKEHRKNSLKNIVFPQESVFTAIAKIPQGHLTAQTAHCAVETGGTFSTSRGSRTSKEERESETPEGLKLKAHFFPAFIFCQCL